MTGRNGAIKAEPLRLKSYFRNGAPMYVGAYVLVWVRLGATWHLLEIVPASAEAP